MADHIQTFHTPLSRRAVQGVRSALLATRRLPLALGHGLAQVARAIGEATRLAYHEPYQQTKDRRR